MSIRPIQRLIGLIVFSFGIASAQQAVAQDPAKTEGPNACAECHKDETAAWQASHHFKTFREMPRKPEGKEIAKRMGIRRINREGLCLNCHYTVQGAGGRSKAVAGISCESCHGGGKDWIKLHSEFSGKTEQTETDAEEAARWQQADSLGMIRPVSIYRIAKNCYGCHVVPQEKLVNVGGHPAGSKFELVSWSQGEVRHNTWYSKGNNEEASAARKRILYVVGLAVEVETALRAIADATIRQTFAFDMAERVDAARQKLSQAAQAAPNVPELAQLVQLSYSAGLKLNNAAALTAAADGISQVVLSMTGKYDGTQLASIDGMIPGANAYKGQARQ